MPEKCRAPRRASISVEVEMPPGVTIASLRRRGALRIVTTVGSVPTPLPVIQTNGVARTGN